MLRLGAQGSVLEFSAPSVVMCRPPSRAVAAVLWLGAQGSVLESSAPSVVICPWLYGDVDMEILGGVLGQIGALPLYQVVSVEGKS